MFREPLSSCLPQNLLILFHGYGATGEDLISLGYEWKSSISGLDFLTPNGLDLCEQGGGGYQWFSLWDRSLESMLQGAQKASPFLESFIEKQLEKRKLSYNNLVLMGFSQGAMMALHLGMTLALSGRVCAGIMAYSGIFLDDIQQFPPEFMYPPVLLYHGEKDGVVDVSYSREAAGTLKRIAPSVELSISRELGHSIDAQGIALGTKFLQSVFNPS